MTRHLTEREHKVLAVMIESAGVFGDETVSPEDRSRWRAQLSGARAGRSCECGTCPSIEIEINDDIKSRFVAVPGTRLALQAGCPEATLLLFIDDDHPSYLELAPHGDRPFSVFPLLADITV